MNYTKKIFQIALLLIVAFFGYWIISVTKCEVLTTKYENMFDKDYIEELLGNIEYFKVVKYSNNTAKLYCVSENHFRGDVITFTNKNGNWKYKNWDTIWSINGSSDNVLWPYWWHFFFSHPKF